MGRRDDGDGAWRQPRLPWRLTVTTMTLRRRLAASILAAALGGCASYRAQPLPPAPDLPAEAAAIVVDRSLIALPELAAQPFDARGGLGSDEVAMLAVVNNPELRVARADAKVAHAQAFAAGVLPDPQLALTRDVPRSSQPGTTGAFNLGLSEDINALLRHSFDREAGRLDARKTDLQLLWQEWQVVARARSLHVRLLAQQRLHDVLAANQALFAQRWQRAQAALAEGLLTLDAVTPHLVALQDIERQLRDLERQRNANRHELDALLGLAPSAVVPLRGSTALRALDEPGLLALLPQLPRRRPDLLALQYGYRAEDQRLRAAIRSQFPTFTIGFTRARDTAGLNTIGLGVTLGLPLFGGARGPIAIEEATRDRLYQDYRARLDAAAGDVHRILAEERINAAQLRDVNRAMAELSQAAAKADAALRERRIDASADVALQASLLAKQLEQIQLEQSIALQRVALQTLVGGELPLEPE